METCSHKLLLGKRCLLYIEIILLLIVLTSGHPQQQQFSNRRIQSSPPSKFNRRPPHGPPHHHRGPPGGPPGGPPRRHRPPPPHNKHRQPPPPPRHPHRPPPVTKPPPPPTNQPQHSQPYQNNNQQNNQNYNQPQNNQNINQNQNFNQNQNLNQYQNLNQNQNPNNQYNQNNNQQQQQNNQNQFNYNNQQNNQQSSSPQQQPNFNGQNYNQQFNQNQNLNQYQNQFQNNPQNNYQQHPTGPQNMPQSMPQTPPPPAPPAPPSPPQTQQIREYAPPPNTLNQNSTKNKQTITFTVHPKPSGTSINFQISTPSSVQKPTPNPHSSPSTYRPPSSSHENNPGYPNAQYSMNKNIKQDEDVIMMPPPVLYNPQKDVLLNSNHPLNRPIPPIKDDTKFSQPDPLYHPEDNNYENNVPEGTEHKVLIAGIQDVPPPLTTTTTTPTPPKSYPQHFPLPTYSTPKPPQTPPQTQTPNTNKNSQAAEQLLAALGLSTNPLVNLKTSSSEEQQKQGQTPQTGSPLGLADYLQIKNEPLYERNQDFIVSSSMQANSNAHLDNSIEESNDVVVGKLPDNNRHDVSIETYAHPSLRPPVDDIYFKHNSYIHQRLRDGPLNHPLEGVQNSGSSLGSSYIEQKLNSVPKQQTNSYIEKLPSSSQKSEIKSYLQTLNTPQNNNPPTSYISEKLGQKYGPSTSPPISALSEEQDYVYDKQDSHNQGLYGAQKQSSLYDNINQPSNLQPANRVILPFGFNLNQFNHKNQHQQSLPFNQLQHKNHNLQQQYNYPPQQNQNQNQGYNLSPQQQQQLAQLSPHQQQQFVQLTPEQQNMFFLSQAQQLNQNNNNNQQKENEQQQGSNVYPIFQKLDPQVNHLSQTQQTQQMMSGSDITHFENNYNENYYPTPPPNSVYVVTEPEPIIEIIVQDSNVTLPPPPPIYIPTPGPPTPEPVHVFYVKYSQKNKTVLYDDPYSSSYSEPEINLENPVASINVRGPHRDLQFDSTDTIQQIHNNNNNNNQNNNNNNNENNEEERSSTTFRTVINPQRNEYSPSKLAIHFDNPPEHYPFKIQSNQEEEQNNNQQQQSPQFEKRIGMEDIAELLQQPTTSQDNNNNNNNQNNEENYYNNESKEQNSYERSKQLPSDVPHDLKQQLISSGILNNADVQVINFGGKFDENLFKELSSLPPEAISALQNQQQHQQENNQDSSSWQQNA